MEDLELNAKAREGGRFIRIVGECKDDEYIKLDITRQKPVFMRSGVPHREFIYHGQFVIASFVHESEVIRDDIEF
jgi:hypothetical protein